MCLFVFDFSIFQFMWQKLNRLFRVKHTHKQSFLKKSSSALKIILGRFAVNYFINLVI